MPQTCTTTDIEVTANTVYLDEYSKPAKHKYFFSYRIDITNHSDKTVQLLSRHWIIIDSDNHREEVKGDGVVGKQPILEPGQSHSYYSFCDLKTNFGTMEGSYLMADEEGETFEIQIPKFYLADNLREFEANTLRRGQCIKHKHEDVSGVIVDYDMYFLNDEKLYEKDPYKPAKDKPWYYILVHGTNAIAYIAQEHLEDAGDITIEHPLVDFFFDGYDGDKYIRNDKSWEDLR